MYAKLKKEGGGDKHASSGLSDTSDRALATLVMIGTKLQRGALKNMTTFGYQVCSPQFEKRYTQKLKKLRKS